MLSKFLSDVNFHQLMEKIDQDLAEQIRINDCPCGGRLHRANYPRVPLGVPDEFHEYYQQRESFCCEQEDCRKRVTPPSVRFWGRFQFVAPVLILISALSCKATEKRCKKIQKLLGIKISKQTWQRWCRWWSYVFKTTTFWKSLGGILPVDAYLASCPRSFLENMPQNNLKERLVHVLQFLAPMTAGAFRAV